jgi:tRNA(Ile)-lysidine synthase
LHKKQEAIVSVLTASVPALAAWPDVTGSVLAITAEEADSLFSGLLKARGLVLAVSGGPDSTAMMHLAADWHRRNAVALTMSVASVDHGLRPEAASEVQVVAQAAKALQLPHHVLRLDPATLRGGAQEAARDGRYDALYQLALKLDASHIVTGHMLEDQAETILMRLAAGSGLTGLVGMRPEVQRGAIVIVRPFLNISKPRLVATCDVIGAAYARDPSNEDARYARSRWRSLMPALAAEKLTPERLAGFARRVERIDESLDFEARTLFELLALTQNGDGDALQANVFLTRGREIVLRTLVLAVETSRAKAGRKHVRPPLARAETLTDAILDALKAGLGLRRTLGGVIISLDARGRLSFKVEGMRRRGISKPFGADDAFAVPLSLGNRLDHS